MATKSISQLDTQSTANETDLFEVAIVDANSASGYASKKESAAAIADAIVGQYQYPLRITGTTAKTIAGAINELKNLVDLLPQFAIEVVQTLPVSDISTTTIYLVPASDPEQGNYYEEYIYVNNAWELVGTTAVDLTGYYTKLEVDGLLATKANTADVSAALELKESAADMEEDVTDIVVDLTDTIETAEGNPITLQTVQEGYAKAVTIKLTPKQDLHGYDKPWVGGTGKNQFDKSANDATKGYVANKYLGTNGREYSTSRPNTWFVSEYKELNPNEAYTISGLSTSDSNSPSICFYDSNKSLISGIAYENRASFSFTTPNNTAYYRLSAGLGETIWNTIQLEAGATATAYEPYANICPIEGYEEISATRTGVDGATATAEFSETIYGAEGDVAGGDWEKAYKSVDLGTLTWGSMSQNRYVANLDNCKATAGDYADFYSEMFTPKAQIANGNCWINSGKLYVVDTDHTTISDFLNFASGNHICYEIATPEPFQTAPSPLTLRKGNNTITTDGDSVKVKYNKLALPDIGGIGRYISALEARIEALESVSNTRSLSVSPVLTKSIVSDSDTAEGKAEGKTEEETKEEAQKNER